MELILSWLLLAAAWIRIDGKGKLESQLIRIIFGAIVSTIIVYFIMVPTMGIIIFPLACLFLLIGNIITFDDRYDWNVISVIGVCIAAIFLTIAIAVLVLGSALFAEELYTIPNVREVQNSSAKELYIITPGSGLHATNTIDINKEIISSYHIRTVPKESAEWKADKAVGELGFKYEVKDAHIQFRKNELTWLVPLEYSGDYKAFVYGDEGIDGYVSVSAENPQKSPERILGYKMKYVPSAVFGHNLRRHIYFKYPNYYQKENVFQLDNIGLPIYVTMLTSPSIGYTGEIMEGIVVTYPQSGNMEFYNMNNIPSYIERVVDESLTEQYLGWWGGNIHGFWNTIFSQKDMRKPTGSVSKITSEGGEVKIEGGTEPDVYLVYGTDNRLYWFTSITTVGIDLSMVGYTLTDVVSGNTTFYRTEGFYNDIAAAKNVQQHADVSKVMGYHVSQPIMYILDGAETWIIPVLASTNEVKAFGIVNGKTGTTFVGSQLPDVLLEYKNWLAGNSISISKVSAPTTGVIAILIVQNGQTKQEIPLYMNTTIQITGSE